MNTTSWQKLAQMWLNERSRWGMTLDCPGGPEMYCNHKRPCKKFRWQKRRPGTCGSGNWSDMATSKEKLETTRSWRVRDSALEPPGGTCLADTLTSVLWGSSHTPGLRSAGWPSWLLCAGVSVGICYSRCKELTQKPLPKLQWLPLKDIIWEGGETFLGGLCWIFRRRQWHLTPVLLPGKSHGRRSLVGCHLWGRTESDTTEAA